MSAAARDLRREFSGIGSANDAQLVEQEAESIQKIKAIMQPAGIVPRGDRPPDDIRIGKDGLPDDLAALEAWADERTSPPGARSLVRRCYFVLAIRAERADRVERRKVEREAARARSRERLEANLADAPMIAARFQSAADRFNAAVDVYTEVVEAFAVVLGSANVAKAYESFVADVQSAAQALDVDVPELPEIEFSKHDARGIYAVRGSKSDRFNPLVDLVPKTPRQSVVASDVQKVRA